MSKVPGGSDQRCKWSWLDTLVARLHEEISPRATFTRFKHYVEYETTATMVELLTEIRDQAVEYRGWHDAAADPHAQLDACGTTS